MIVKVKSNKAMETISFCSINLGGNWKHIAFNNSTKLAKIYFSSANLTEEEIDSLPFDTPMSVEEFNQIYHSADFQAADYEMQTD